MDVDTVQVGIGPRVWRGRLPDGAAVELRALPLGGQTTVSPALAAWDPDRAGARLAVVTAGPAVNLATVATLLAVGVVEPDTLLTWPSASAGTVTVAAQLLASANLLVGVGNLVPLPPADGSWAVAAVTSLAAGRAGDGTTAAATRTGVQLAALVVALGLLRTAATLVG